MMRCSLRSASSRLVGKGLLVASLAWTAGAEAVVMDGLDGAAVGEAVALARPDVIVHQMTAISMAHAGKPDIKHPDR